MPEALLESNIRSDSMKSNSPKFDRQIKHSVDSKQSHIEIDNTKTNTQTKKYVIDHKTMTLRSDPSPLHRVFRQLLEACLFEKIVDYIAVENSTIAESAHSTFYFSISGQSFVCQGRLRGFERIRLYIRSLKRISVGKLSQLKKIDIDHLIDTLCKHASPEHHLKLYQELQQSLHWWELVLEKTSTKTNWDSFSYQNFESALYDGHPYHPCFKARSGFSFNDHNNFSPESAQPFQLIWLALPKKSLIHTEIDCLDTFWKSELNAELYSCLYQTLENIHFLPNDFSFIPCHPWQWKNYLEPKLRSKIDTGEVLVLGTFGEKYIASQSVRTLLNSDSPNSANLKFPLDIVSTSSTRYLMSYGLDACKSLCSLVQKTIDDDDFFIQYPLVLLNEYAGLRVDENFYQDINKSVDHDISHFSVLFRESVESRLYQGESALPLNALFFHNKIDEYDSCLDSWIKQYGLEIWLTQILKTVVLPVWHLLVAHGIALEAHGQNLILIHKDGWPIRLAVRDLHESLEFVPDFLKSTTNLYDFEPLNTIIQTSKINERYAMDDIESLRWLMTDTLFIFNLSELAEFLDAKWQFSEDTFWMLLRGVLNEYKNVNPDSIKRQQSLGLFNSTVTTEALFTRKCKPLTLDGIEHEYQIEISNPLS